MFGLSFGEILVIAILALVVLGPKELPTMLRTLGRTLNKLRRMSTDLRKQSGIDEIIREEGLHEELATLRSLRNMSASGALESFIESSSKNARKAAVLAAAAQASAPGDDDDGVAEDPYAPGPTAAELPPITLEGTPPEREAEYPEVGCDAYGARLEAPSTEGTASEPQPSDAEPSASAATATGSKVSPPGEALGSEAAT
ncbi:MAG: twin-arginine translocase subunit TatB [Deltaproteobacteria bacterium]|nr:twin-arginine translocase subunit TatB [Deltaproteobacteria bacterium]